VDEVLRGASDAGAQTKKVFLSDLDIHPCIACEHCAETGACAQKDDMQSLAKDMAESSVWVLGTPVYLFGPTAQFKAFLDRWIGVPKNDFAGKGGILVVPFASSEPEIGENTLHILKRSLQYRKMNHLDSIAGPGLLDAGAANGQPELLELAYKAGQQAVSG